MYLLAMCFIPIGLVILAIALNMSVESATIGGKMIVFAFLMALSAAVIGAGMAMTKGSEDPAGAARIIGAVSGVAYLIGVPIILVLYNLGR